MKAGVFTVRSDSSRLSVFEAGQPDEKIVARKIEAELRKVFNKDINVIIRSLDYLRKLRSAEPFRHIKATPDTRLYVTFLPEKAKSPTISVPFVSAGEGFRIPGIASREIFSVVDLSKGKGTTEAMSILEREFGSNITTRNWNTPLKVLELTQRP